MPVADEAESVPDTSPSKPRVSPIRKKHPPGGSLISRYRLPIDLLPRPSRKLDMPRTRLTLEQRRERGRLRALHWRRAHGIGPRKPAARPWVALGISRSTMVPPAGESRRASGTSRPCGRARPAGLADCRIARESRSDRCGQCGYGGGVELSAALGVETRRRRALRFVVFDRAGQEITAA